MEGFGTYHEFEMQESMVGKQGPCCSDCVSADKIQRIRINSGLLRTGKFSTY
jgi:hypothetical protein